MKNRKDCWCDTFICREELNIYQTERGEYSIDVEIKERWFFPLNLIGREKDIKTNKECNYVSYLISCYYHFSYNEKVTNSFLVI